MQSFNPNTPAFVMRSTAVVCSHCPHPWHRRINQDHLSGLFSPTYVVKKASNPPRLLLDLNLSCVFQESFRGHTPVAEYQFVLMHWELFGAHYQLCCKDNTHHFTVIPFHIILLFHSILNTYFISLIILHLHHYYNYYYWYGLFFYTYILNVLYNLNFYYNTCLIFLFYFLIYFYSNYLFFIQL